MTRYNAVNCSHVLTLQGSLETAEMKLTKVYSALNIPKDRFYIFATLLGNHIVLENDLSAFYSTLDIPESQPKVKPQLSKLFEAYLVMFHSVQFHPFLLKSAVIEAVAQFVRALDNTDRGHIVDLILEKSHSESATYDSLEALRLNLGRCLKYYGTITGKALSPSNNRSSNKNTQVKKEKPPVMSPETGMNGRRGDGDRSVLEASGVSVLPSDGQDLEVFHFCQGQVYHDLCHARIHFGFNSSFFKFLKFTISGNERFQCIWRRR